MNIFERIEELGQRNKVVPAWVRAILVVPFMALAGYMIGAKKWIYLWLRDWQLDNFEIYYVVLTALITILICLIPSVILVTIAQKYYSRKKTDDSVLDDDTMA